MLTYCFEAFVNPFPIEIGNFSSLFKSDFKSPKNCFLLRAIPWFIGYCTLISPSFAAVYEAEKANVSGFCTENRSSASGGQDIGCMNSVGAYVSFTVTTAHAGAYVLDLNYSLGYSGERNVNLYINNVKAGKVTVPSTGSWDTFESNVLYVQLKAGTNYVKYQYDTENTGEINFDRLKVIESNIFDGGFASTNGGIATDHTGFNGFGFVAFLGTTGDYASFAVYAPVTGKYAVLSRYAAGFTGPETMNVYVNDTYATEATFLTTTSWDKWSTQYVVVDLKQGTNTIKYQKDSGNTGNVNFDYIELIPTGTYPALYAKLSGGAMSGDDGSAVGYTYAVGATVQFTVYVDEAGTYPVDLRYAFPSGNITERSIYVNGTDVKQGSFYPTGSWGTFVDRRVYLTLNAGINSIAYKHDNDDSGDLEQTQLTIGSAVSAPELGTVPKYQGEDAEPLGEARISPSGTGMGEMNSTGAGVVFFVYAPEAGEHNIEVNYGLGGTSASAMGYYINGTKISQKSFAATGEWDTFKKILFTATLKEGLNTVMFKRDAVSDGPVDFDYIAITHEHEAEAGTTNADIGTAWKGFRGTGYVEDLTSTGKYVEFTVDNPESSSTYYIVTVRYSSDHTVDGSLSVYLNGTDEQQLVFPSTGGWDDWGLRSVKLELNSGSNTIRFQQDAADVGYVNLDYLTLSPSSATGVVVHDLPDVTFNTNHTTAQDLTKDFSLYGLPIKSDGLKIIYTTGNSRFSIYGDTKATFENGEIDISLGTSAEPGIRVSVAGGVGTVDRARIRLEEDLDLGGLILKANDLKGVYNSEDESFRFSGVVYMGIDDDSVQVLMGNTSNPGLKIKGKSVDYLKADVYSDFQMKGIDFDVDDMDVTWDGTNQQFTLYGTAKLTLEGSVTSVKLGDSTNPGIVIKNNELQHIELSIDEDLEMKGFSLKTTDVGFSWDRTSELLGFFGDTELDLEAGSLNVDLGTSSSPGMLFQGSSLKSMDATINSDFTIGAIEVEAKDVEVKYVSSKFYVTGTVLAKEIWKAEIDLGENGSNGLEIDFSGSKDRIILDDLTIELDHADLGALDLKQVKVVIKDGTINETEGKVYFPPGYELDADIKFTGNPAKLNAVDISFDATSLETAIAIGDTGLELVHMEGSMSNLTTSDITFSGSVGIVFGGPISLAGHDIAFLYQEDDITINKTNAKIDASLLLAAYKDGSSWSSVLGDGTVTMDLEWGRYYKINAHMKFPSDPFVSFDVDAVLSSNGTFAAFMDVRLVCPHGIPLIGGHTIGSTDGGVRYNKNDLNNSFAAGWQHYWFFGNRCIGAYYNFGSRSVDWGGTGTMNHLAGEINNTINSGRVNANEADVEWTREVRSFELVPNNTSTIFEIDFGENVPEAHVSITGPDGVCDTYEMIKTVHSDTLEAPDVELGAIKSVFTNQETIRVFVVPHEPEHEALRDQHATMTPGKYDVKVAYRSSTQPDSTVVTAAFLKSLPIANAKSEEVDGNIHVDLDYWSQEPDSTTIHLYWNDTAAYSGRHIVSLDYGAIDSAGYGKTSMVFNPAEVVHGDEMFFYLVIDDGTNVPVRSQFTKPIKHTSPLSGTITITNAGDSLSSSGIVAFLDLDDDGFHDTPATGGVLEPCSISDASGNFHFNELTDGEIYSLKIIEPSGYSMAQGGSSSRVFQYDGSAQRISFNIKKNL